MKSMRQIAVCPLNHSDFNLTENGYFDALSCIDVFVATSLKCKTASPKACRRNRVLC